MKFNIKETIATAVLSIYLAVQGWTLLQIVSMEKDIAAIKATLHVEQIARQ